MQTITRTDQEQMEHREEKAEMTTQTKRWHYTEVELK